MHKSVRISFLSPTVAFRRLFVLDVRKEEYIGKRAYTLHNDITPFKYFVTDLLSNE